MTLLPSGHTTSCVDGCNYTWTAGPATGYLNYVGGPEQACAQVQPQYVSYTVARPPIRGPPLHHRELRERMEREQVRQTPRTESS